MGIIKPSREKMVPVFVRLPNSLKEKAEKLAKEESTDEQKLSASDVYRTAIEIFLSDNFTDSKVKRR